MPCVSSSQPAATSPCISACAEPALRGRQPGQLDVLLADPAEARAAPAAPACTGTGSRCRSSARSVCRAAARCRGASRRRPRRASPRPAGALRARASVRRTRPAARTGPGTARPAAARAITWYIRIGTAPVPGRPVATPPPRSLTRCARVAEADLPPPCPATRLPPVPVAGPGLSRATIAARAARARHQHDGDDQRGQRNQRQSRAPPAPTALLALAPHACCVAPRRPSRPSGRGCCSRMPIIAAEHSPPTTMR